MTHAPHASHEPLYAPAQPTNGLAIAGFVCSIVGLLATGGLLSPVGLILSLIALGRPFGRGWAVAGIVIGLIGTCGWLALWLVFAAAILAAIGLALGALVLSEPQKSEITYDMVLIHEAIESSEENTGFLPASLGSLGLETNVLTDPWGNPYRYVLVESDDGFDIISDGADAKAGTPDDVQLSKLDQLWQGSTLDISVEGNEDRGSVVIDLGDKTIEIKGDDNGGAVITTQEQSSESDVAPETPPGSSSETVPDSAPDEGGASDESAPEDSDETAPTSPDEPDDTRGQALSRADGAGDADGSVPSSAHA